MMKNTKRTEQFIALLTSHQSSILAYIHSLIPGCPDAHDVLQQVNITLWRKMKSFKPNTNFKAWAFSVVRFHILNFKRKKSRANWLVFDDDLAQAITEKQAEAPSHVTERQEALQDCLDKLNDESKQLIKHRYEHEEPLKVYAARTKVNIGTVKARLFHIRNQLRQCIEKKLNNPAS